MSRFVAATDVTITSTAPDGSELVVTVPAGPVDVTGDVAPFVADLAAAGLLSTAPAKSRRTAAEE